MTVLLGDTNMPGLVTQMRAAGIGRMVTRNRVTLWYREPWALDNGAYSAWKAGAVWDPGRFLEQVAWALEQETAPLFAVLPDIPTEGARSFSFSLMWQEKLPPALSWVLPIQDGMTEAEVRSVLPQLGGLFLGGSDAFKATAPFWAGLARAHGRIFHYARASTRRKLRLAWSCSATSCDSALPVMYRPRFREYLRWVGEIRGNGVLPLEEA